MLRAIVDLYEGTGSPMGPEAIESATGFDDMEDDIPF